MNRSRIIVLAFASLIYVAIGVGCANFTPQDAQGYASAAQTVVHAGIADYKDIKAAQRK